MSRSRWPSNAESARESRQLPDRHPDDYRNHGRDRDGGSRGDRSFYRRDYAESRDRTRTFDLENERRRNSASDHIERGHERPGLSSRKCSQDQRSLPTRSPLEVSSERESRQSSPRLNSESRPISPKGDPIRPGAATPITITTSITQPSKVPAVGVILQEPLAISKVQPSDNVANKDPRLRRINTQVKPNSETSAVNEPALDVHSSSFSKAGSPRPTIDPSNIRSLQPSISDTPVTAPEDVVKAIPTLSSAAMKQSLIDDADVTMTDTSRTSTTVPAAPEDSYVIAPQREKPASSSNLMKSFEKLLTGFADQVSSTSVLKYKKDIAKQKQARCKQLDEKNREKYKDFPVTIEQGKQARQLAEQELASVDQNLKNHVRVQNELARTVAEHFVSQVEQNTRAQEIRMERTLVSQQTLDKFEEISAYVTTTLAEMKEAKQSEANSVKEAYDRATHGYKEAQQAEHQAQRREMLSVTDHLKEDVESLRKRTAIAEDDMKSLRGDKAQRREFMSLTERLTEIVESLRKRTSNAEDDIKSLRAENAHSVVFEGMRKDFKGELAQVRQTQRDVATRIESMGVVLERCKKSYETLAPEVKTYGKKIDELGISFKVPSENEPTSMSQIEKLELSKLRSDFQKMQQSFQGLSQGFESLATKSEFSTLRNSMTSLQGEIETYNIAELRKEVEALCEDAKVYHEDLTELEKEVDKLHIGQDDIQDKFTARTDEIAKRVKEAGDDINEVSVKLEAGQGQILDTLTTQSDEIAERVKKAEDYMHEMSVELHAGQDLIRDKFTAHNDELTVRAKKAEEDIDKTREEIQNMAHQTSGISKRLEATMTVPTARPTPPSAPPTPQMHQSAHLAGRGSVSPVFETGVVIGKLNENARSLTNLTGYINGQFSTSPNLPARLSSLEQALINLQSRYNNLSTEPVVRAMVQQMQLMYPFASTAQNEIGVLRGAVIKLEKLPSKIDLLNTQVDRLTENLAKVDRIVDEQERERLSSDLKRERLVGHVTEERDKLKQHVQEQHEKVKQHVEEQQQKVKQQVGEQYGQLGKLIAVVEESVSGVAEVAMKVTKLEQVMDAWKAERLSQLGEKEVGPKPLTQLQVNEAPHSGLSARDRKVNQAPVGTPEESAREALLKKFDATAHSKRTVPAASVPAAIVINGSDDSDGSDVPLAASRTNSSKTIAAALPEGQSPGTSAKRKRAQNASNHDDERKSFSERVSSPSKRKAARYW